MNPRMSLAERKLLENFLKCSDHYLEFGSGGSTCVAASLVKKSVTSVDSASPWLDAVSDYCTNQKLAIVPRLVYVDIGPVGGWGKPTDHTQNAKWPDYHSSIWSEPLNSHADLYMVDGRFRVACFMQIALHCDPDATIIIHDFTSRSEYHVVREVARELCVDEDLSVFRLLPGQNRRKAIEILEKYKYDFS